MSGAQRDDAAPERGPRPAALRVALGLCALLLFAGFVALGNWQVERRAWKLDLIERVAQRVHAPVVEAPGVAAWPQISAAADEYRHVRLTGVFQHDRETLVQATTERGAGFWVLTPLRQADGRSVLVNRGFVPPERRERGARGAEPAGEITVTGLLRMSEPSGVFPRKNDPAADRWYARDVPAIAAARGLADVAPYFVDAEAEPAVPASTLDAPSSWPVGGLTVIAFHNSHLVYALTWYALALMVALGAGYAWREERRAVRRRQQRRRRDNASSRPGDDPDAAPHP